MRLKMLVDVAGNVPVKVIARTFASGKTEKLVYQCLADLGLPSGKVGRRSSFTHIFRGFSRFFSTNFFYFFLERRHRACRFYFRKVLRIVS